MLPLPGSAGPTLATITIDGAFEDWVAVLNNTVNVTTDNMKDLGDLDSPPSADRDLVKYAWTYDSSYLYSYVYRTTGGTNVTSILLYVDGDADGVMESTEKVIEFRWSGANQRYDATWYDYTPVNPSGDTLTGDGAYMPGSLSGGTAIESNMLGGASDGIRLEARFPWTALGGAGPRGIKMHVSSARGTSNVNQIEDNMAVVDTRFAGVTLSPNNVGAGSAGVTVTYNHTVTNTGSGTDSFNITTSGTRPQWTVVVIPTTVGPLAAGASGGVTVQITIPGNASNGVVDTTTVRATAVSNASVYAEATDTTTVGSVVVTPNQQSKSSAVNQTVSYSHTVYNYQAFTDTINLSASSSQGWSTAFYQGVNPVTSVTLGSGASTSIEMRVMVPAGAVVGTVDTTTVTGESQADFRVKGTATDQTTAANRLAVTPNNTGVTGPNSTIAYTHTVTNSWSASDTVNLTAVSSNGWTTRVYDSTGLNQISSVSLGSFGSSAGIVVHLDVPSTAGEGASDTVTVTASSATTSGVTGSATSSTTVRKLTVYSDAGRTQMATTLTIGDTGYARGTGLTKNSKVYFRWVDAGGTIRATSPQVTVDAMGMALHQYTTLSGDTASSGTPESVWTALLLDSSYNELGRYTFAVRRPDHLTLTPASSASTAGTDRVLTVQVVDYDGRTARSPQAVTVTASGAATITATSLSGASGIGTNQVSGTTGADGSATVTVTDNTAETVTVTPNSATLPGSTAVPDRDVPATIAFQAGPAYQVAKLSGDKQVSTTGGQLVADFVARVGDAYNNAVAAFAPVTFAITGAPNSATGQSLTVTSGTTNGSGQAATRLTLGNREGRYQVSATNGTLFGSPISYTASYASYVPAWSYNVGQPIYSSPVIPATDPPYITDDVVYIGTDGTGSDGGWIYAVYAASGTLKWSYNIKAAPSAVAGNIRSFLQVYWDDLANGGAGEYILYFSATNGHVYAMHLDGTLYWESVVSAGNDLSSAILTGPVNVSGQGLINVVYVGSADGKLYGIRSTNGQVVLSSPSAFGGPVLSTPAIVGDYLWVGSDDGSINQVALSTLTVAWSTGTGGAVRSSPWVDYPGTTAYVGSTGGGFYAVDANNGGVITGYPVNIGSPIYTSPWVDWMGGTGIYLAADNHRIYRFNTDGTMPSGWPYNLDTGTTGTMRSSPMVIPGTGGMLAYAGGMDELFHVARHDSPTSSYLTLYDSLAAPTQGGFYSSPGTNGWLIAIGNLNGLLYGFPLQ